MGYDEKTIASIVSSIVNKYQSDNKNNESFDGTVPVGVSNRHIHLTKEHLEILFGPGYQLNPLKAIEGVRVLGPLRSKSQVEISRTDSFQLKVKPPVRESGKVEGSAPITIVGPKGIVQLKEGCIIANRHIHMSVSDGEKFGVKDGDYVAVETSGDGKRTTLYDVQIRVSEKFVLEMHLDTDDANACGIGNGSRVKVIKNK